MAKKSKVSYPWDEWIKQGRTNEGLILVERKDYKCMTSSMTRAVRKAATRRGYAAKVFIERGTQRGKARCDKLHINIWLA